MQRAAILCALTVLAWAGASQAAQAGCENVPNISPPKREVKETTPKVSPPLPAVHTTYVDISCPRSAEVPQKATDPPKKEGESGGQSRDAGESETSELQWIEVATLGVLLTIAAMLTLLGMAWLIGSGLKARSGLLHFRRYWGGFGGDISGWNVSAPLGRCCVGLILLAFGAALAAQALVVLHDHEEGGGAGKRRSEPLVAEEPTHKSSSTSSDDESESDAVRPASP